MIKLDLSTQEWPFSEEVSQSIFNDLYSINEEDLKSLEEDKFLITTHLFNEKNVGSLQGFQIKVAFQKIDNTIKMNVMELFLIDDEDEWLSIYKNIKNKKSEEKLNDQ